MAQAPEVRIVGAYHVATFPGWQEIVEDQCERLRRSGLLNRTQKLLVGVVGDDPAAMPFLQARLGEVASIHCWGPVDLYEFPTLQRLFEEAQIGDFRGWYIHTKGVSCPSDGALAHRLLMESVVIDNHLGCCHALTDYDLCGARWLPACAGEYESHFTGNFWWATAEYLRTLPPPNSLDQTDRYAAEFWIGRNEQARPCELTSVGDPWSRPSAWIGLEDRYQELCELDLRGEIRRVVEIGVDYGFSAFHFARDFPNADVVGVDDYSLHPDAEIWVRSHLALFPNLRIRKGPSA
ncbi:MAG TPA: hypothetical protein PLX89_18945, partial [Verrucomicrobiota bacterium]|nr:hypothetical protein [Verrucomicrobiota bacterium]